MICKLEDEDKKRGLCEKYETGSMSLVKDYPRDFCLKLKDTCKLDCTPECKALVTECKKKDDCKCGALKKCKNKEGKVVNALKDTLCSKEFDAAKDEYKALGISTSGIAKKIKENGMEKCQEEEKDDCPAKSD